MENQRNLILAIALSVAILIGFQYFFEHPKPPPAPQQPQTAQQSVPAPSAPGQPGVPAQPAAPSSVAAPPPAASREQALADGPRIKLEGPRVHGSLSRAGGRIDDVTLANYHETTDPKSPEIVLLSPPGAPHPYFVEFGWLPADKSVKVPDSETPWTVSGERLTPASPVTLSWDNGAGLKFTRTISVDENYLFTVKQAVENTGASPVTLYPYGLITRVGTPATSGYYILHEGMIGVLGGTLKETKYSDLKDGKPQEFDSTGGWLGITDKYWQTALVPDPKEEVKARFAHTAPDKVDRYQVDYRGAERVVPVGGSAESTTRVFAGAKELKTLIAYQDQYGIDKFDLSIDFGWFWFLTKPIFLILDFFNRIIGNFGLSILLLTVIVKLLFFPLANKSYHAMSKMKKLQPKMTELREKYGEDKARLNQEMMALYKKEGANPLAGCLPIVIQIPVFFSLYKVLFVTIEMRQAPFYGWIHDLSAPDPTNVFNLFGLLPFEPHMLPIIGGALAIGAWPIIMGCTMFLQQKLNPQPADPVQAKMFMFLPIIFTYMLAGFPAGLVIYWAWNNTLSVAQQWVIMRQDKAV
jgi:YidC/Oxa1 family membrane protein insertase